MDTSGTVTAASPAIARLIGPPVIATLLILATLSTAEAGIDSWTTNGPYGGTVSALAIHPQTPSTIYAGSRHGGVFRSTDGGNNWSAAGLADLDVRSIVIDPQDPTTIYAGTQYGGVFKSLDGGGSWTSVGLSLVLTLVIDPATPATLYAGTEYTVFKSVDGGATWAATGLTNTTSYVFGLVIDPNNPDTLYAGTRGGVFKTVDGGTTWMSANAGLTSAPVLSLAIDPETPTTLYAGTQAGGVFKSTDGGGTWTPVNTGLSALHVNTLAVESQNPTNLYAGTESGVFRSSNGGASWSIVSAGAANTPVLALALHPDDPAILHLGTRLAGFLKTFNGGATWMSMNSGLTGAPVLSLAVDPQNPATVYAGTRSAGVFKTTDGGMSWRSLNTGLTNASVLSLAIDPLTPTTVYAGTDGGGVFKSIDGGGAWTEVNSGLTNNFVMAVAIDPHTPTTLYVGTWAGVFKSTDANATWNQVNTGLTNTSVRCLAVHPLNPSTLYAGTDGGVFSSSDGGSTWRQINSGLTSPYIRTLAIDPEVPTTVYAGTSGAGVFRSTDGGETWVAVSSNLANASNILSVAIDAVNPSIVSVGTDGAGVFRTLDAGQNWDPLITGLTNPYIKALAVDRGNPTTLYAATPVGIFVFQQQDTAAPSVTLTAPADGLEVSGQITVSASASDDRSLVGVLFMMNGAPLGAEVVAAPYTLAWDTWTVPDGLYSLTARGRDAAGNTSTSAPVTVTVVNRRYEETTTTLAPDEAAWTATTTAAVGVRLTGDRAVYSSTAGATASFAFTGTGVKWIGFPCEICGIANVILDGVSVATVDTFAPTRPAASVVMFATTGLRPGNHTLTIEVSGTANASSGGTFVVVDGFAVVTEGRYEESAATLEPTGAWSFTTGAGVGVALSGDASAYAAAAGATATFTFSGIGVTWVGMSCEICGIADVLIDGIRVATVDTFAAARPSRSMAMFTSEDLSPGSHTLAIVVTGASNASSGGPYIVVDAFDVAESPAPPPGDTTSPTVALTSPSDGAMASGTITLSASATDDVGVTSVQFFVGGTTVGPQDETSPYSAIWDTRTMPDGTYTITARARDAAGNIGVSAPVTVTIANGTLTRSEESAATLAPDGLWTSTTSGDVGAVLSGDRAVYAAAPDASATFTFTGTSVSWIGLPCEICGIADVLIDGTRVATIDTYAPTRPATSGVMFTASALPAGSHTLIIRVTGGANPSSGGPYIVVDAIDVQQ